MKNPRLTTRKDDNKIKYLNEWIDDRSILDNNSAKTVLTRRAKYISVEQIEIIFVEPLFLHLLVRKQCLVWRLVQQRDIRLPSDLLLVTANTFRSSRVSISGLSYIRRLSTRTRDFIPEIFKTENYKQDWWINERKYFLRDIINQTSQC